MGESAPKIEVMLGAQGGRVFRRWTRVGLSFKLGSLANSFHFEHVDSRRTHSADPLAIEIADTINEHDPVQIKVNGKTMLDGYVDTVRLRRDVNMGPLCMISGRSRTADLIDSAAQHKEDPATVEARDRAAFQQARALLVAVNPAIASRAAINKLASQWTKDLSGEWEDALLGDVSAQVCAPFGIEVKMGDGAAGPDQLNEIAQRAAIRFRRVCIEPGETALAFLNKLAKERGLTITSTPEGNIAYTIAGIRKIQGGLAQGVNIADGGERTADGRERFSSYRVFGQAAGDDAWHGETARGGDAIAVDDQVTRYRPFVEISDGTASGGDFENRAIWERNRRAARGRRCTAPVVSWLDPEKNVWLPNRLIDVKWPDMRVEGELLIDEVRLNYDLDDGDTGQLGLVHPGAYDPLQSPKTRKNRKMWAAW
jgi:prophage tail gpP-like protein